MSASDSPTSVPVRNWMATASVNRVFDALTKDGAEARFVGGCVRDSLLGRPVNDIDIATPLAPDVIIACAEAADLKAIPTGIAHGTVTLVANGVPFQVTTLREDLETDGRHAVVAFTDDWEADAARRDFTFNAMSCHPDGKLFDYFDGAADLAAGRVRFVGDPATRLEEDLLRLLRFYRMHAWFGRGDPDPAARAACRAAVEGLPRLSMERVRDELLKTLRAPNPAPVFEFMAEDGVLADVLPEANNVDRLQRLVSAVEPALAMADDVDVDSAPRRLAAVIDRSADVRQIASRLKFSNKQAAHLSAIQATAPATELDDMPEVHRRLIYALGSSVFGDAAAVRAAESPNPDNVDLEPVLSTIRHWRPVEFPLSGADLLDRGIPAGPAVGEHLQALEQWWINADFRPDRGALLEELDRRLAEHGRPA